MYKYTELLIFVVKLYVLHFYFYFYFSVMDMKDLAAMGQVFILEGTCFIFHLHAKL